MMQQARGTEEASKTHLDLPGHNHSLKCKLIHDQCFDECVAGSHVHRTAEGTN
jgi:hypothetical protein